MLEMGEFSYYYKDKKMFILLLYLYIIAIPFQKIIWLPIVNNKIQIPEIIFVILILLFIPKLKWADWKNIKMTTLDKAIMLWLLIGTINLFIFFNVTTFVELSGQFYLFCLYFLIQFIFFNSKPKEIELFFTTAFLLQLALIIITLFIGLILLTQYINIGVFQIFYSYPYFGNIYRLKVLTNEPVMLVSILSIPFWIITVLMKRKIEMIPIKKWGVILLLILTGLMLSGTFGKSLPFMLAILFIYFITYLKNKNKGTIFIKIIASFLILSSIFLTHVIVSKKPFREKEVYGLAIPFLKIADFYLYKSWYYVQKENAIKEFIEHPYFGCGGGNLLNVINLKYKKTEETILRPAYDPLSTYTGILAEYGILGFLALLFLIFTIYKEVLRLPDSNGLKWIFIFSFTYFMLEAISTDIQNFRHLWILLGFFGVTVRSQQFPVNS
jgi:O-antigen ligase